VNLTALRRNPAVTLLAGLVLGALVTIASAFIVFGVTTVTPAPSPRPCVSPSLPSGDQMQDTRSRIWTCTDGTWHLN
jgi:hypothetical protein